MSSETIITSFPKSPERETDSKTVANSDEAEPNASQGESIMYSSDKVSTHIDLNRASTVSTETESIEAEKEKKEEKTVEDSIYEDSEEEDDDFPKFEGGEARGRVVQPVAGPKTTRPVRPK